jgi:hypothetical protein
MRPPSSPVPVNTAEVPLTLLPDCGELMVGLAGASRSTTMSREPEMADEAPPPISARDWVAWTTYEPEGTLRAHDQYPESAATVVQPPDSLPPTRVVTEAPGTPYPETRPLVR